MSWDRQKLRLEKMSPEELAAHKEHRKAQQRRAYHKRMERERAAGVRPPVVKRAPMTAAEQEAERVRARQAELDRKRKYREEKSAKKVNEFLSEGAQTNGFTAFLRSREAARAAQMNKEREAA